MAAMPCPQAVAGSTTLAPFAFVRTTRTFDSRSPNMTARLRCHDGGLLGGDGETRAPGWMKINE
ncbi:hypothetical protein CBM2595_A80071 [Cupriavidus taiwanensis]|nr:hypothetical protein CBM2595_A80071 [Cupriavidus taiwanensis]